MAARQLRRRARARRLDLPGAAAQAAAVPRGRAGRRQDRGRQGARGRARHGADPAAVLRRPRRQPRGLRVELPAADPRDPPARRRVTRSIARSAERELFTEALPDQAAAAARDRADGERPPVLLIDEIDRADEEFEGYLLELLSDFQITIPELGTIRAAEPPVVVITSNRTREVHDALKRRCVYCWIDYPGRRDGAADRRGQGPGRAGAAGRAGHGVRAGAAHRGAVQDGRRLRDARLGGGAGGA